MPEVMWFTGIQATQLMHILDFMNKVISDNIALLSALTDASTSDFCMEFTKQYTAGTVVICSIRNRTDNHLLQALEY